MWSHWAQFIMGPATVYVFAIGVKLKLMTATRTDMIGFTAVTLFAVAANLMIYIWTAGLDVMLLRWVTGSGNKVAPESAMALLSSRTASAAIMKSQYDSSSEQPKTLWRSKMAQTLQHASGAGFKQQQLQLLTNVILLLLGTPFASWITVGVVWVCRLAAIAIILLTSDKPCTMEQLRETEPGFGLVVDAAHLRAALQAYLAGVTYQGPLLRTRGSYYTMDDTLTISYR